ncbi:unnamed protein product, partial [Porites lobata]
DCDHAEYIGQTKRQFGTHLNEQRVADYSNSRTNHTIAWDNSKIITTKRRYHLNISPHQRLCLQGRHINSALAPLNRDDGGLLLNIYLHLIKRKRR